MELTDKIRFFNCDCMSFLAETKDKAYSLAICDVPYGIGKDGQKRTTGGNGGRKEYEFRGWDKEIPSPEYFKELFRVSENQILFGANYFPQYLKPSMGWIIWDKGQRINQSDGELIFTSFDRALRIIEMNRVELLLQNTIHPTEKPVKLLKYILSEYAKPGDKILDTHAGSFSIGIACHELGFELDACELDVDYYNAAIKRFKLVTSQHKLF